MNEVLKHYKREDVVIALHVSDPHLGYNGKISKYSEFKPLQIDKEKNGWNIRTLDVNDAFKQTIDIALEREVDVYLNGGDGFDNYGYRLNLIENFYTNQYMRLKQAGIPIVEIVGNHNFPNAKDQGCHLERIAHHEGIYTVYKGLYEPIDLPDINMVVHCVPSTFNQDALNYSLSQVQRVEGKINVGLGHFGVTTIKHYAENAHNSLVVELSTLVDCKMDYFALADYHKPLDLGNNIEFAGSIERLGTDEIDNQPQVILSAFNKQTGERIGREYVYLNVRPMIKIELDCQGKTIERINADILRTLQQKDYTDAILILKLLKFPSEQKRLLCHPEMKELTKHTLAFRLEIDKVNVLRETRTTNASRTNIVDSWAPFARKIVNDGSFDSDALVQEGLEILQEVINNED